LKGTGSVNMRAKTPIDFWRIVQPNENRFEEEEVV
jgi:hypothetical protein